MRKILIVEDNPDFRDLLAIMLKDEGYTVYTADDGEEGVKLVDADCPDLIITDINMPHMDGIEMVRVLRQKPECNRVPIIVLSAYGSGNLKDAIKAGADEAVRKPLDYDWFVTAINRLLE
ncbi:MAG TPA: response regulator [Blastocatellia bacterium]|jgi:CheY-like chemotaxis protein